LSRKLPTTRYRVGRIRNRSENRKNGTTPTHVKMARRPVRGPTVDGPPLATVAAWPLTGLLVSSVDVGHLTVAPTSVAHPLVITSVAFVIWSRVGSWVPDVSGSFAWAALSTVPAFTIASYRIGLQ
jgi:hypothetical protein